MIDPQASDDPRAAQLETDFPGWWVWISDTGNWWASLRRQLTYEEIEADCVQFIRADDEDELRERLGDQLDTQTMVAAATNGTRKSSATT